MDVPKITRDVEPEALVTAFAFAAASGEAENAAAEFMLRNMSKRMADGLREEMQARGKVRQKDGEAAMTQIVAAIRDMTESGEITLIVPDDDD